MTHRIPTSTMSYRWSDSAGMLWRLGLGNARFMLGANDGRHGIVEQGRVVADDASLWHTQGQSTGWMGCHPSYLGKPYSLSKEF